MCHLRPPATLCYSRDSTSRQSFVAAAGHGRESACMCWWTDDWADGPCSCGASRFPTPSTRHRAGSNELLRCRTASCPDSRQEQITGLISDILIDNMLPVSLVESPEFCTLQAFLEPAYKPRSHQMMTPFDNWQKPVSEKIRF